MMTARGVRGKQTVRNASVARSLVSFVPFLFRSEREVERRASLGPGRVSANPAPSQWSRSMK